VWIDETRCDQQNSPRKYGYSIRGIATQDYWIFIRAISVMALEGVPDVEDQISLIKLLYQSWNLLHCPQLLWIMLLSIMLMEWYMQLNTMDNQIYHRFN